MALQIKWNLKALQHFEAVIEFIEQHSPANADRVKRKMLSKIDDLLLYPEIHPPDKFKIKNDGSFRAFEIYHYRISYFFKNEQIRIIRIRHTAMNPKSY